MTSDSERAGRHPLIGVADVAALLGVEVRHVRRLVHERRIPFIKWGHLVRFDPGELAHLILEHDLSEVQYLDGVPFRTCRPDQEEEATTLGGTILLPRKLLLAAARDGLTHEDLAQRLGVTSDMARYRWNITGVDRQLKARSKR